MNVLAQDVQGQLQREHRNTRKYTNNKQQTKTRWEREDKKKSHLKITA
jgi:hypothetical protein